jgi:polyisoprenoid-binding protein YceI
MKSKNATTTGLLIVVGLLLAGFINPAAAAETYKLDPAHTSVVFRIKHLGVAYVYGRFNGPTGAFVFDESSPSKNSIQMQVDAQNVDIAFRGCPCIIRKRTADCIYAAGWVSG